MILQNNTGKTFTMQDTSSSLYLTAIPVQTVYIQVRRLSTAVPNLANPSGHSRSWEQLKMLNLIALIRIRSEWVTGAAWKDESVTTRSRSWHFADESQDFRQKLATSTAPHLHLQGFKNAKYLIFFATTNTVKFCNNDKLNPDLSDCWLGDRKRLWRALTGVMKFNQSARN